MFKGKIMGKDSTASVRDKLEKDNINSINEKSDKDSKTYVNEAEELGLDGKTSVNEKSDIDGKTYVNEKSDEDSETYVNEKLDKHYKTSVNEKSDKDCKTSVNEKSDIDCKTSVNEKSDKDCKTSVNEKSGKDNTTCVSKNSDKDNSSRNESTSFHLLLPERPERPLDSDCCGSGCTPCVMDIYYEEMALWEAGCKIVESGLSQDGGALEQQMKDQTITILHPVQYVYFPILDIKQEALDSVRIRCGLARNQTLGLTLGQHIIVRSQVPGSSLTRQYTPVSPLDTKGYFELLIKIYPEGRMSERVRTWKVGDKLEARGPAGHLEYVQNKFRRVLMLCAGSGIAPMCPVISSILADDGEETYLRLVYACRSYSHLMAKSEIDEWRRFWNFSCLFAFSQEPDSPNYRYKTGEDVYRGHVDKVLVDRELGSNRENTLVLVCGTRSFDIDMMSFLKELGVPETNIHKY